MSVFRIEKTNNYTVMSNYHLREREMSLKAKGLLSLMLSLPNDWDYTIEGLVTICKENETAIKSTLKELKNFGYLEIKKVQNQKGQFEYEYNIYEKPQSKKPEVENLEVENPSVENQGQLNTNKQNTKKINTNNIKEKINKKKNNRKRGSKEKKEEEKINFAEFVSMTNADYEKLVSTYGKEFADQCIKKLDNYKGSSGKTYKSDYRAILSWVVDGIKQKKGEYYATDRRNVGNQYEQNGGLKDRSSVFMG